MPVKFDTFTPEAIEWQDTLIDQVLKIKAGDPVSQWLLSGGWGSAKTTPISWLATYFCINYPNMRVAICRASLPDIKASLYLEISDQLDESSVAPYITNWSDPNATIRFENGSEIFPLYWGDGNFDRLKTKVDIALFDELSETRDKRAYLTIIGRLGRRGDVPSFALAATNPEEPDHWIYEHFVTSQDPNVKAILSNTYQNVYLPKSYTEEQEKNLSPSEIRRYLKGEWIYIGKSSIYDSYSAEKNYVAKPYVFRPDLPIDLSFDFNISEGKPFSACVAQFDRRSDTFHFGGEVTIEGARTYQMMEEIAARGYLDNYSERVRVFGDASGKYGSTKSLQSDYDIILQFLRNYSRKDGRRLVVEYKVPPANPPIRERHNLVKAYCLNGKGDVRLFVYSGAPTCHKGMLYTKLAKGAELVEVQDPWQHISTAMGYYIVYMSKESTNPGVTYANRF